MLDRVVNKLYKSSYPCEESSHAIFQTLVPFLHVKKLRLKYGPTSTQPYLFIVIIPWVCHIQLFTVNLCIITALFSLMNVLVFVTLKVMKMD